MTLAASDSHRRERPYWILLTMVTGIGPVRFQRLLEVCGGAEAAWYATDLQMAQAGIERRSAHALSRLRKDVTPDSTMERLERLHVRALTLEDDGYPPSLRTIPDPPPVLFVRGELSLPGDEEGVAVVGTRRATAYGRAVAELLARDVALASATVVSGLAKGIDTVAHRACLDAGGRTVAVLGNGLDQVYPPENAGLARRIVDEGRGAVVSEFPPGMPPDAANFPRRNRIIAGLSRATVVVEAGFRSGALITADFALEQGREVLAVPGSVLSPMSAGPNDLIKHGAAPVTEAADILRAIHPDYELQQANQLTLPTPDLSGEEAAVLEALGADPKSIDEVARGLQTGVAEILATLTLLELKGLIRQVGAMRYVRAAGR